MDVEAFRARALVAFPAGDPPAGVVSDLAREVHADAALIEQALMGKPWTAVSQSLLNERAKDIVALSIPAFVYYIPAFLCAAVQDPEGDAATYAMYALCPLGNFDTFMDSTCAVFSAQQAGVIVAFLSYLQAAPSFTLFTEEMKPGIELWKRRAG